MKKFLKAVALKTLSPELGLKLRRYYLTREILNKEGSNEPEFRILHQFLDQGDSVIDIGANVGAYTREFSRLVGHRGQVYAFEPVRENHVILEAVIRKANLQNVRVFRAALGAEPGECDIVIPKMDGYTGYYWAHLTKTAESGERESVVVHTLDELALNGVLADIDFIKCDVEGGELDVVTGASKFLHEHHPGWFMEVSKKTSSEIFGFFQDLGYTAYVYDARLTQTETYRDKEFSNYFFFHPQSTVWERIRAIL